MSLNQKYTWNDFLKENPELKAKEVKRSSPEGKKAFEAAYKAKIKDVLKDRLTKIEKETARAGEKKIGLMTVLKERKKGRLRKVVQAKVGKTEKYIHRLGKMSEKTKLKQKSY